MHSFELISPASKQEVLEQLASADEDTRLIAGGTGLLNLVKQRLASPDTLVSLHKVRDLTGIDVSATEITIHALERLIDVEHNVDIRRQLPLLAEVLGEVASPRIRSMATIGGAIAHGDPNQDTPLALMALDAMIVVESNGASREIAAAEFYKDYYETALQIGEMVTAVRIPLPKTSSRFGYKKFTPGSKEDYACVNVCVRLDMNGDTCGDCRIVLGSVGPTVFRAVDAEAIVRGQTMSEAVASEAAETASTATDPVDDTRGSAAYKRRMTTVWVKRTLLSTAS